VWTREASLDVELRRLDYVLSDSAVTGLADGIAPTTYRRVDRATGAASPRSSAWLRVGENRQLRFRQGTPTSSLPSLGLLRR